MARISNLKPSITDMSHEDALSAIIAVRTSRRTSKKPVKTSKATKQKKQATPVSQTELFDLISALEELDASMLTEESTEETCDEA